MLRKIINLIKYVYFYFWKKKKTLKNYLSQKRPIDRFWSGPARLEFTDRGEALGQHFVCPPGPVFGPKQREPSDSMQRPRVHVGWSKPARAPLSNPNSHFYFSPATRESRAQWRDATGGDRPEEWWHRRGSARWQTTLTRGWACRRRVVLRRQP
jgi:hypothetical protein